MPICVASKQGSIYSMLGSPFGTLVGAMHVEESSPGLSDL